MPRWTRGFRSITVFSKAKGVRGQDRRMASRKQRIWITRAQPGADVTAERVRALGHEAVVAPLLAVRMIPDVSIDLRGVAALAFTSANGVRAFADASGERGLKVFAVGAATASAARAAGFN